MYESTSGVLYDPDVARTELMGVEETRKALSERLKKAEEEDLHTVMTRHGKTRGVIVDIDWYRRARESLGEPTDL